MEEFISVPVPASLVTDVMAFIARRASADPQAQPEVELPGEELTTVGNRFGRFPDWSIDRLQQVLTSAEPGPQLVAAILDHLEQRPSERVPLSELAATTGRTPDSVKSLLSAFTKWVKRELNDLTEPRNWPVNYQALPGKQVAKETHYWITAVTAERWQQLRREG
jgi:hypothetical protein